MCEPASLPDALERVSRGFLFATVYVAHAYASTPLSTTVTETSVCVLRSTAASLWVLAVHTFALPLALVQVCLILNRSFAAVDSTDSTDDAVDVETPLVQRAEPCVVERASSSDRRLTVSLGLGKNA